MAWRPDPSIRPSISEFRRRGLARSAWPASAVNMLAELAHPRHSIHSSRSSCWSLTIALKAGAGACSRVHSLVRGAEGAHCFDKVKRFEPYFQPVRAAGCLCRGVGGYRFGCCLCLQLVKGCGQGAVPDG
jgi:hypothetical protein